MPGASADRRRIIVQRDGPTLVEGPVEIVLEDGTTVTSDRFCVALCTCRRSRRFPWCDTSHRKRSHDQSAKPSSPSPALPAPDDAGDGVSSTGDVPGGGPPAR